MSEVSELADAQRKASRLAARANIRDVRLFATNAKLVRPPDHDRGLSYSLDSEATVEHDPDDSFIVRIHYRLTMVEARSDGSGDPFADPGAVIAEVEFEHGALFALEMREGDAPVEAEELAAYAASTGQFALFPYAREYIYDLTGRLALPPLTIGVLQLPVQQG